VNELRSPSRFLKAVAKPKSNEKYPGAKEAVKELKKSLRSVVIAPEEEQPLESVLDARTTSRLTTVLERVCRLSPPASGVAEPDEDEDESDDSGSEPPTAGGRRRAVP
jgi:hypothetical protein